MQTKTTYNPSLFAVLREAARGKSVGRTLTNLFWCGGEALRGAILDIGGGGGRGSHYRFLSLATDARVQIVDVVQRPSTNFVLDITRERVPLQSGSQDHIFLFNILEHLASPAVALREAHRLLKDGGTLLGSIPFLVNVHPDPHDFTRFTGEALEALFARTGFKIETIVPIGRGPFLAAYEQLDMLIWSPLHLVGLPLVWSLDALLARLKPRRDLQAQFPLAYNFIVRK